VKHETEPRLTVWLLTLSLSTSKR